MEVIEKYLNQSGPEALSYKETDKPIIIYQTNELLQVFKSLNITTNEYTHINGSTSKLLKLYGTLPMYYQEVKYNVPVEIWLMENYPREAPHVYVKPTPGMVIKPQHVYVDACGYVLTPYIQSWSSEQSSLLFMAQDISICFGSDPPLFSKTSSITQQQPPPTLLPNRSITAGQYSGTPNYSHTNVNYPIPRYNGQLPNTTPISHSHHIQQQQEEYNPRYRAAETQKQMPQLQYQRPYLAQTQYNKNRVNQNYAHMTPQMSNEQIKTLPLSQYSCEPSPPVKKPEDAFFKAAKEKLSERATETLNQMVKDIENISHTEDQALYNQLNERRDQINTLIEKLRNSKSTYENKVQSMSEYIIQLQTWLNKAKINTIEETEEIDIDSIVTYLDEVSKQALEAQAEDLAIEDALDVLNAALKDNIIDYVVYLKQTRQLCERQFMARALCVKIKELENNHMLPHNFPPPPPPPFIQQHSQMNMYQNQNNIIRNNNESAHYRVNSGGSITNTNPMS